MSEVEEAARAESVGHGPNCRCRLHPFAPPQDPTLPSEQCIRKNCGRKEEDHPVIDPNCLPSLRRASLIRAEAMSEALEKARAQLPIIWTRCSGEGVWFSRIKALAEEARADLERLKNEGRKQ